MQPGKTLFSVCGCQAYTVFGNLLWPYNVCRSFYQKPPVGFPDGVFEQQGQTTTNHWSAWTNPDFGYTVCCPCCVCVCEWCALKCHFIVHSGLGCITECVRAATHPTELLYLCEVCVCRVSKADIRSHITGSLHRYKYIVSSVAEVVMASLSAALGWRSVTGAVFFPWQKARHPNLVSEWEENCNLSKMAWPLMEKAKMLEAKQGPGHVQVFYVERSVYAFVGRWFCERLG